MNSWLAPRAGWAAMGVAALGTACSAGGTGSMQSVIDSPPPVTAPHRFIPVDTAALLQPADTLAGEGCLNPMADPVTGIQITLYRSESGLGDYLPPSGAYGIRDGLLIRLECNTGEVVGIVRR